MLESSPSTVIVADLRRREGGLTVLMSLRSCVCSFFFPLSRVHVRVFSRLNVFSVFTYFTFSCIFNVFMS